MQSQAERGRWGPFIIINTDRGGEVAGSLAGLNAGQWAALLAGKWKIITE